MKAKRGGQYVTDRDEKTDHVHDHVHVNVDVDVVVHVLELLQLFKIWVSQPLVPRAGHSRSASPSDFDYAVLRSLPGTSGY
jgi:hypothetical protein